MVIVKIKQTYDTCLDIIYDQKKILFKLLYFYETYENKVLEENQIKIVELEK